MITGTIDYFRDRIHWKPEDWDRLPDLPAVADLLTFGEKQYADLPAIRDRDRTLTYTETNAAVRRKYAFLVQQKVPEGSRVAVAAETGIDAAIWTLAVMAGGYTAVLLPPSLPAGALAGLSLRFQCRLVLAGEALIGPVSAALKDMGAPVPACTFSSGADQELTLPEVSPETPAAICLTSGTTGGPKGVLLSNRALMRGAYNGILFPNPKGTNPFGRRYMTFVPLFHVFGLVMNFLSALYTGGSVYFCPDVPAGLREITSARPTVLVLVPGLASLILGLAASRGPAWLGGLETIICGAAGIPQTLYGQAEQLGIELYGGYGMTEGANLTAGGADQNAPAGSIGMLYPGQQAKLVDGELWIRGDNLMTEYAGDPEGTAAAFTDGWFRTGDLARFDGRGFLFILGRKKNVIILENGENVSPEELEAILNREKLVKEVVVRQMEVSSHPVIGAEIVPDPELITPGKEREELQAMLDRVNSGLPSCKRIAAFEIRTEPFPRTGSMEIRR